MAVGVADAAKDTNPITASASGVVDTDADAHFDEHIARQLQQTRNGVRFTPPDSSVRRANRRGRGGRECLTIERTNRLLNGLWSERVISGRPYYFKGSLIISFQRVGLPRPGVTPIETANAFVAFNSNNLPVAMCLRPVDNSVDGCDRKWQRFRFRRNGFTLTRFRSSRSNLSQNNCSFLDSIRPNF